MNRRIISVCLLSFCIVSGTANIAAFDVKEYKGDYHFCGDFTYVLNEDGTAHITSYNTEKEGITEILEIPETLDGHIVVGLDRGCFGGPLGRTSILQITVPWTVYEIDQSVTGGSVEGLDYVEISDKSPYFTDINGIVFDKKMETLIWYPEGREEYSYDIPADCRKIEDYAFKNCESLENVELPDTLESIGEGAFTGTSVSEIFIPENVEYISSQAFRNCPLHYIHVSNNDVYQEIDGVLFNKKEKMLCVYPSARTDSSYSIPEGIKTVESYVFFSNQFLLTVNLPESIETLKEYTFYCMPGIEVLVLPESLKYIGKNSICANSSLKSLTIPKNVEVIEEGALTGNYHLQSIQVDEKNKRFSMVDGVLFDDDTKTLILYPAEKADIVEYYIPDGTEVIGENAIINDYIEKIILPEGINDIREWGISCENLREIYVPKSIENMENLDFPGVTYIVKTGSYAAQWVEQKNKNYRSIE